MVMDLLGVIPGTLRLLRSVGVVLDLVLFSQQLGLLYLVNISMFRNSYQNRLVMDFTNGFPLVNLLGCKPY